jgi:hypothetical protein
MSTATHSTTVSSNAQAVAVANRLQRDLDELRRAAAGAALLPADDAGHSFDIAVHLGAALTELEAAIKAVRAYSQPADRAERMQRWAAIADQFNAEVFGL